MPAISINLGGDHEAFGLSVGMDRFPILRTTADWHVDALKHGMRSGATSLMVVIPAEVDAGRGELVPILVMAEMSLNAWMMATSVLAAAHRDEVEQPGWAIVPDAVKALLIPRYAEVLRRVLQPRLIDQAVALEIAEMFIDGLGAGAPTEEV